MAKEQLLYSLIDLDDEIRYFTEADLLKQLTTANFEGTAPIKAAFKHFANAVQQMRQYQNEYFKTKSPLSSKMAKDFESKVDAMVKRAGDIELL